MKNRYYLVVTLNNKINSKDIRKQIKHTQYLTSKTWANKYYTDELTRQLHSDKESTTTELWYVTEYTDKAVVQILNSTNTSNIDTDIDRTMLV